MISNLYRLFKGHKKLLLLVLSIITVLAAVKTVLDPLAMKYLVDDALVNKNSDLFIALIAIIVVISVANRVGVYISSLLRQKIANKMTLSLTTEMTDSYFDLPYEKVSKEGEGYFINRVYDEPATIAASGTNLIVTTFENIIIFIAAVIMCLYLSWMVTVILSVIVPVLYFISTRYGKKIKDQSKEETEAQSKFREGMVRSLEAYKIANLFSLKDKVVSSSTSILGRYLDVLYDRSKTSNKYRMVSHIFMSLSESLVLSVAAVAVFMGALTVGGLLAYMTSFWKMMYAIVAIVERVPDFSHLSAFLDRIQDFKAELEVADERNSNELVAKNLAFSYGENNVLKNVSFALNENESLIVNGANGSGKSTLLHMLVGFLPSEGKLEAPSLDRMSAMLAPLKFFQGTLREHLNYDELSEEKKNLAGNMLVDFGLQDKLDSDPDSFSEGEKRKAQLIMTLLKDAEIYIFDEPTAAVDVDSKDSVMYWIKKVTENCKMIMVMHGDEHYHSHFDKEIYIGH